MSTETTEVAANDQEAFRSFVQTRKIIPVELVSINPSSNLLNLAYECGAQHLILPKAQRRSRFAQNAKFSNLGEEESTYGRISVSGMEIHDSGYEFVDKDAAMQFGNLRKLIRLLGDTAQLVKMTEEVDEDDDIVLRSKIEIRNRPNYSEASEGLFPVKALLAVLEWIPDSALVGVRLWVNPDRKGWFKYNLVIGNCNQKHLASRPLIDIQPTIQERVLTLEPGALGINF